MNAQNSDIKGRIRHGTIAGVLSYCVWGFLPIYWKLLDNVSPVEIMCHRIIWCFVFTAILCAFLRLDFIALIRQKRARRYLVPSSIFITMNWSIFIFAVSTGHIVDTSIGYYLNPLVSIVFGMAIFKERLMPLQWAGVALCCIGIAFFTLNYGQFPLISVLLALTFATYGAIKKKAGYPAIETIAIESAVMLPFALAIAIVLTATGIAAGSHALGWAGMMPEDFAGTAGFLDFLAGSDGGNLTNVAAGNLVGADTGAGAATIGISEASGSGLSALESQALEPPVLGPSWLTTLLLIGAGIATATPLVLYTEAANNIPLTLLGFLQYLSPSISLLIGVFMYGEAFTFAHAVCFGCIWSALVLVGIDSVRAARKSREIGELTQFEQEELNE